MEEGEIDEDDSFNTYPLPPHIAQPNDNQSSIPTNNQPSSLPPPSPSINTSTVLQKRSTTIPHSLNQRPNAQASNAQPSGSSLLRFSQRKRIFKGCVPIEDYKMLAKCGEGTFGEVHKARHTQTGQLVAIKRIILHREKNGFPVTSLREIRYLKWFHHKNIIPLLTMAYSTITLTKTAAKKTMDLLENSSSSTLSTLNTTGSTADLAGKAIPLGHKNALHGSSSVAAAAAMAVGSSGNVLSMMLDGIAGLGTDKIIDSFYMVFPYMDHDLHGLIANPQVHFTPAQAKYYMREILEGIAYMHDRQIIHRDIKSSNILLSNNGELRIADFGLAQQYCSARREYTPGVVTSWYRPPELLLGSRVYGTAIDMWGVGCIFLEIARKRIAFPGDSDLAQLKLIAELCGKPTLSDWPDLAKMPDYPSLNYDGMLSATSNPSGQRRIRESLTAEFGACFADLLDGILQYDPAKRTSAKDALKHSYFSTLPLPAEPRSLPSYPTSHEYDIKKAVQQQRQPVNQGVGIDSWAMPSIAARPPPLHHHGQALQHGQSVPHGQVLQQPLQQSVQPTHLQQQQNAQSLQTSHSHYMNNSNSSSTYHRSSRL